MQDATLKVPGMNCGHCKGAVEGELDKLAGVESSNVDLAKGTVEVSYDEGRVTIEELASAIEDAGYAVAA